MAMKYLNVAETAKLVRKILKESFRNVKFSVRSSSYSGGCSITIKWQDGPNVTQVQRCVNHLKSAYFDGSIDYKGGVYHMINGECVSLSADSIHYDRAYSEPMIERAIARLSRNYLNLHSVTLEEITAEDFKTGKLWSRKIPGIMAHSYGLTCVQTDLNDILHKASDRMQAEKSHTAATIFVTHDDGYSRAHGSGKTAISI